MRLTVLAACAALLGPLAAAQPAPAQPMAAQPVDPAALTAAALERHILPGFARLSAETAALDAAAGAFCDGQAERAALVAAYHAAFDAWMGVSHLRFGPLETDARGAAIAFWPDARGATPRTLMRMLAAADPAADDPAAYAEVSIAARGLLALDWLLFDAGAPPPAPGGYPCRLTQAVAADLAATAAAAEVDWRQDYAPRMIRADGALYRTPQEALVELRKAFAAGLEATTSLRVLRPLGGEPGPRPRLTEAWRSGRPLRNVRLSLEALEAMAMVAFVPAMPPVEAQALAAAFARARAAAAPAPMAAALERADGRAAYAALAEALTELRALEARAVAGAVGAGLGFNAMDGD